jgi:hypothetical protein
MIESVSVQVPMSQRTVHFVWAFAPKKSNPYFDTAGNMGNISTD